MLKEKKSEFPVTEICTKCPHLEDCTTSEVKDEAVESFFEKYQDAWDKLGEDD
jgi:hypothetical protein